MIWEKQVKHNIRGTVRKNHSTWRNYREGAGKGGSQSPLIWNKRGEFMEETEILWKGNKRKERNHMQSLADLSGLKTEGEGKRESIPNCPHP